MRKVIDYPITDETSRDKGKIYRITEMPAMQSEKWAYRAGLALAKSGVDIGPHVARFATDAVATREAIEQGRKDEADALQRMGMVALARAGIYALAGLDFSDAEPLLDELLRCVTVVNDGGGPVSPRPIMGDDVEEPETFTLLRKEVINLHVGFLMRAFRSTSGQARAASPATSPSPPTSTSPTPSQPVFRPARRASRN